MISIEIQNWGLIDYITAWERQKQLVAEIQSQRNRLVLVLCQHPTVITIGRNGNSSSLLLSNEILDRKGIKVVYNDRGGDATLHNPNQLVGYPIFDLSSLKEDLHWFLRKIENCIILLLKKFGINSETISGLTGVWIEGQRKICAMGFHCSKWVTSHGFALNVSNDLSEFDYIIPCGIRNKSVTSICKEIGMIIDIDLVESECKKVFFESF